jgi:thiol-disulfide isomerase/thioredoxin
MKKYHFILYYLIMVGISTNAQNNKSIQKKTNTVISGYFDDERTDTVRLFFYEQKLGQTPAGRQEMISVTHNGHFYFNIPIHGDIGYVTIRSNKKTALSLSQYLLRRGDSVNVNINTFLDRGKQQFEHGLTFTGINCGAFPAKYHADSAYMELVKVAKPFLLSTDSVKKDISYLWKELFDHMDIVPIFRLAALDKVSSETDKEIISILATDYLYSNELNKLVQFQYYWNESFRNPDSLNRRSLLSGYFIKTLNNYRSSKSTLQSRLISSGYMEYATLRTDLEAKTAANLKTSRSAMDFLPIIERENPATKEKLLTAMIAYLGYSADLKGVDSLIKYGMHKVRNSYLHNIVSSYRDRSLKGSPAFNFTLADIKGKPVSLSSFIGKTVVIDFWFTGCVGCVQVGKGIKKVKERFVNDTSVVFVSISADFKKEEWLESIREGVYTDSNCVNLYTMGKGQGHELMKFYDINSYPRLMIIDKQGKLFAFNAERPGNDPGNDALTTQIKIADL